LGNAPRSLRTSSGQVSDKEGAGKLDDDTLKGPKTSPGAESSATGCGGKAIGGFVCNPVWKITKGVYWDGGS